MKCGFDNAPWVSQMKLYPEFKNMDSALLSRIYCCALHRLIFRKIKSDSWTFLLGWVE